ncbi:hypothetical protein ACEN2I_02130 [Flavobacterium sp. W22_SRS_FK3]|uniref:hypothetical protein n=1 Tax=Flavobacterium sp. W22_SRS_FK3 TaxID=3240275 RepID=UPI003F8DC964
MLNFPGHCFVEETKKEGFDLFVTNDFSQYSLPSYLILSKKKELNNQIYQAMNILLMDKNYEFIIDYNLDFDVIGKIEIYKQMKELKIN